jgi:hypothetical protein
MPFFGKEAQMKMILSRIAFLGVSLVLLIYTGVGTAHAVCLFSCNELDRDKAASILTPVNFGDIRTSFNLSPFRMLGGYNNPAANKSTFEKFIFGSDAESQQVLAASDAVAGMAIRNLSEIRKLAKNGIVGRVTWNEYPIDGMRGTVYLEVVPQLAPDVAPLCSPPFGGAGNVCNVLLAKRKFGMVTGIAGEGKARLVQFTVVTEPNALGLKLGAKAETQLRTANFVLYDDGWRLVSR